MSEDYIDAEGFRANVGIVVSNPEGKLLWTRRVGQGGWQFPQGGIRPGESAREAMYRELREEIGLQPDDVSILAESREWFRYTLPERYQRKRSKPLCVGQKQRWFMLRLESSEDRIRFDCNDQPEFDRWEWVDFATPIQEVIFFKREVYAQVLSEFRGFVRAIV